MSFDLATWRQATADRLSALGRWLKQRGQTDAPFLLYGALCGASLWPLVEAAPVASGGSVVVQELSGQAATVERAIAAGGHVVEAETGALEAFWLQALQVKATEREAPPLSESRV